MKLYWQGRKLIEAREFGELEHLKSIIRGDEMTTKEAITNSKPTSSEQPARFSDFAPKLDFYPDLPKVIIEKVLGKEYEITDAFLVKDFTTQYGKGDFVLLLLTDIDTGKQMTTLSSGQVVVKKVVAAIDNGYLPLRGVITYNGHYYDIA